MRHCSRILLMFGTTVVLVALKTFLIDERGAVAGSDDMAYGGRWTYSDPAALFRDAWGGSTGYVSVPHASSLASPPVWRDRRSATAAEKSLPPATLAIVGLPVDTDHEMLSAAMPERLCLAAQSSEAASLCKDAIGLDEDSNFSFNFDLCAFDGDCWHSTAAAVLATGGEVDPRHFSLEAISKLPFWNLTDDVTSRRLSFYKDARDIYHARFNVCPDSDPTTDTDVGSAPDCVLEEEANTEFPTFPGVVESVKKIRIKYFASRGDSVADGVPLSRIVASNAPGRSRMSAAEARARLIIERAELAALRKLLDNDNKNLSTAAARKKAEVRADALESSIENLESITQFHEAVNYAKLPKWAFPLVEVYSAERGLYRPGPGLSSLVNENLLVPHGARRGGPFIAFNVFSAVRDATRCQRFGAKAPCVLTKLTSQERALDYLLERVKAEKALGVKSRSRIAAILIIAGGELSRSPCDDNPTARRIAELQKLGVYTFVPVGNDGDPRAVRFPACVSAAISVGSIDRNGEPMPISNGYQTGMVRLYADGDAAIIPMRAPPPDELRGCLALEAFKKTVQNYQKALRRMGFPLLKDSGLVDAETQDALQAFQRSHKLPPSGKFTSDTLGELDQAIEALNNQDAEKNADTFSSHDEDAIEPQGVAGNVRLAHLSSFEDYENSLCDANVSNLYHAYFVGGTLMSAAVMAGTFLDLVDSHPQAGSDAVAAAMISAPRGKPGRLLTPAEFTKVEQRLK
jgi:hypothetical protein